MKIFRSHLPYGTLVSQELLGATDLQKDFLLKCTPGLQHLRGSLRADSFWVPLVRKGAPEGQAKEAATSASVCTAFSQGPERRIQGLLLSQMHLLFTAQLIGKTGINTSIYLSINVHIFSYIYLFF